MTDEQQPIEGQNSQPNTATETFELKREITFEGRKYTSLTPDFDSLIGTDLLDAERAYAQQGGLPGVAELQKGYLVQVVARACGVPVELINALPASDVSKITMRAQNFLLG